MATKRRVCRVCSGSGWVDANYIHSAGTMGPGIPGNMLCSACGGTGTIETWVPDPRPKVGEEKDRRRDGGTDRGVQVQSCDKSQTGVGGNFGTSIFASGEWLVQHILPLRIMESAGARLLNAGKTLRIVCMMVVAVVFVSLIVPDNGSVGWPWAHTFLTEITGDMAIFVSIAIGALMGWIMPTVAGVLLILTAHLTGLAIILLLIVGLIWLAYEFIIM